MGVKEAANKALEILLLGSGYEDLEEAKAEFLDGSWITSLEEASRAWMHIKYEADSASTPDGFTAKVEAQYGGEGQGDQYWVVISLSDGETTRYFRKDGWYASYDGGELDGDTSEVKPQEKTIVVYQ
jgi:hypothetical protein